MPNQEDQSEISAWGSWAYTANGRSLNFFGDNSSSGTKNSGEPGKEPDVFIYPLDMMQEKTDYLSIKIFDQVRSDDIFGLGGVGSNTPESVTDKSAIAINQYSDVFNAEKTGQKLQQNARFIFLPIPQQVADAIAVSYSEDRINPMQAAGLKAAGSVLGSSGLSEALKSAREYANVLTNDIKGIASDSGTLQAIKAAAAGISINTLGANVSPTQLITRATGQVLQSNLELLFSGVTLRSFPFVYDFTPRNPREAEAVKGIIRTLKKAMTAKDGRDKLFIKSPDVFQLEYKSGSSTHPFLNMFKVCSLADLSVNYSASGTYATYGDGSPVHIQIQMTFMEINPIYSEDYDDLAKRGYKNVGY